MFPRLITILGAAAVALSTASGAVGTTPLRAAATGASAQVIATGLQNTTAFAFGDGQAFAAEVPYGPGHAGGVYLITGGTAIRLRGPNEAFGLAWHHGALYASSQDQLVRMSGWNGRGFAQVRTIYTAPRGFSGFAGIGFGADGRLYAGVRVADNNDHSRTTAPFAYDLLSFTTSGRGPRVEARGLREAWQLAFPARSSSPLVSILGQDAPAGIRAPDLLVRVRPGQNYGFPSCNWVSARRCQGYARPSKLFPPHTDPMSLAIVGDRLYFSEYGPRPPRLPPRVVVMPLRGGRPRTVLGGFGAPLVGLGVDRGWLYVGDTAGNIFRARI
ncbi:MAG: hypothetical protein M3Z27_02435 [Actinomycetota bacterium]|nr:hypothetical protein [Actinomycetota bacterium]